MNIKSQETPRLSVYRSSKHFYAQVFDSLGTTVIASASTLDAEVKKELTAASNISAAEVVGKAVAQRAVSEGVTKVSFDRSGFSYHGRVKALADAARENGLQF